MDIETLAKGIRKSFGKLRPSALRLRLEETVSRVELIDFDTFLYKFRFPILIVLSGLILAGIGVSFTKIGNFEGDKVEVLDKSSQSANPSSSLVVEVAGAVISPGVFNLDNGDRVQDALAAAGGLSGDADREWVDKNLNKAAKLSDGQKIYIPLQNQQTGGTSANILGVYQKTSGDFLTKNESFVNINTATLSGLDSLPGIGPVYGQKIIDNRPYSNIEELLTEGILKKSVYEKIKGLVTVY